MLKKWIIFILFLPVIIAEPSKYSYAQETKEEFATDALIYRGQLQHDAIIKKLSQIEASTTTVCPSVVILPLLNKEKKTSSLGTLISLISMLQIASSPTVVINVPFLHLEQMYYPFLKEKEISIVDRKYFQGVFQPKATMDGKLLISSSGYNVQLEVRSSKKNKTYEEVFSTKKLHKISSWITTCIYNFYELLPNEAIENSITKSEIATSEDINTMAELFHDYQQPEHQVFWEKLCKKNNSSLIAHYFYYQNLIANAKHEETISMVEDIVNRYPGHSFIKHLKMRFALRKKNLSAALSYLFEIATTNPYSEEAYSKIDEIFASFSQWQLREKLLLLWEQKNSEFSKPYLYLGTFYIDYAWNARGVGYANTVTEQNLILFRERLQKAEKYLTQADIMNPDSARASTEMIEVCKGLGYPKEQMNKWFNKSCETDPLEIRPYLKKVDYLTPKWHGSIDEMYVFAEECKQIETVKICAYILKKIGDELQDINLYKQAYELGSNNAGVALADHYKMKKQWTEMLKIYQDLADQGDFYGMGELAKLYEKGKILSRDLKKAYSLYSKMIEAKDISNYDRVWAMNKLGFLYFFGHGVPINQSEGLKLYRKSAEESNINKEPGAAMAMVNLATEYLKGEHITKNSLESAKWFLRVAESNPSEGISSVSTGMFSIGDLYQRGLGVNVSYEEAIFWYTKAAELNETRAMNKLGDMYYRGIGVKKDIEKAKEWFQKSSVAGNENGKQALIAIYFEQHNLENNKLSDSKEKNQIDANNGNVLAMYALAKSYEKEKNYKEALKWFNEAANKEHLPSMQALGYMYETGEKITKDMDKAIHWYKQGAELYQDEWSLLKLGNAYCFQAETIPDQQYYQQSFVCYDQLSQKKGMFQGIALERLGFLYEYGLGVKQDYKKSLDCYEQSIMNGTNEAWEGFYRLKAIKNKK